MRNTSKIGEVSASQVLAVLILSGRKILLPFGDSHRYDLVIEEQDGRFLRVQCKTGRIVRGALYFPTSSTLSRSRTGVKTVRRPYRGEIDLFGVYCPDNGKVYLVPVDDVPLANAWLRVDPPRNNQQTGIQWASAYEIGAVAQLGAR
jgi:hypothetical protein